MNEGGLDTRSEVKKVATAWPNKHYSRQYKAIEEQGDQTTPGKRDLGEEIWTACQAETAPSDERKQVACDSTGNERANVNYFKVQCLFTC